MDAERFKQANAASWQKLDGYNKRLSKTALYKLPLGEIYEFTALYKLACHHLSYAQTYFEGSDLINYLNALAGTASQFFYIREKTAGSDIKNYFKSGFPAAFHKYAKYFTVSLALFFAGAAFIFLLSLIDLSLLDFFLPPGFSGGASLDGAPRDWDYAFMSSYIITNNVRVCFLCMALGLTCGAGTAYVLAANGVSLGALFSAVVFYKLNAARFFALILPHGVFELTAVFLSGAAGLLIGRGILIPRELKRVDALAKSAKSAFYFLPAIIALLVAAGLIEGFFTPLNISDAVKLGFAALCLVLTAAYLSRRPARNCADDSGFWRKKFSMRKGE